MLHTTCVVIIPQTSFLPHNRPTLQHIVDEEAILQLMKNCPICNRKCRCSKHTRSPYLIVYQSCYFCHYQRKWASQPEARNMNIKAHKLPKRKHKPKDKVSVNAKAQSCQLNNTSISESSVSRVPQRFRDLRSPSVNSRLQYDDMNQNCDTNPVSDVPWGGSFLCSWRYLINTNNCFLWY